MINNLANRQGEHFLVNKYVDWPMFGYPWEIYAGITVKLIKLTKGGMALVESKGKTYRIPPRGLSVIVSASELCIK